jgi:hypothetical protein
MALSRQHPLFSPIGCAGGLVFIAGLVVAVLLSGGAIFSPGELTAYAEKGSPLKGFASHADFQNDCTHCHAPFQGIVPERCEACHTTVGAERASGTGLHGKLRPDEVERCETCHADHRGRGLNPTVDALNKFDHAILGFSLVRHIVDYSGTPLNCTGCHTGADFKFEAATCAHCHGGHDAGFMERHLRAFGQECRACHDGADAMTAFDHAQTQFPLDGKHVDVECAACHTPRVAPQEAPTQCAACHAEPPVHAGVFTGQDCAACHTANDWNQVRLGDRPAFRHADTTFQLIHHAADFGGSPITCQACHPAAQAGDFSLNAQTCTDCHGAQDAAFMGQHLQAFGPNCVSCHDGAGNMTNFDHNQVFVLDGRHATLECTACHVEQQFRGTSRECAACHQEPPIHAGLFGLKCEACHNTGAWTPARLTQHSFPLDHGEQGEIACATCHTQSYVTYTCYGCHEHEPTKIQEKHAEEGITGERLLECTACHPTGED